MEPLLFFETHWLHEHHLVVVSYTWFIMALLALFSFLATRRMNILPGGFQNVMEVVVEGFDNLITESMGHEGRKFFPLIATLGLYILTSNLLGLIPGFESPTANLNTTVSMAVVVFVTTHVVGIRVHGFKYVKQFLGPIWWLTPLMLPIEIVSHLARAHFPLLPTVREHRGRGQSPGGRRPARPLPGPFAGLRPDDLYLLHPDHRLYAAGDDVHPERWKGLTDRMHHRPFESPFDVLEGHRKTGHGNCDHPAN